ncbi:MAG: crotonase/enoyl-CoA hydratase family protein [Planktomarina sp.]|nr:crotonase/enoyl-CoA hydratase family protein [Planktomarina sp.]MDT2033456.1 crotonase/enoyl-CoA hydratase family protein [Planktomarina sp.]MDT2039840.1 crotonase/enoyl-CoA hydratase family protein [Planktomarina sp.]MDT2049669.1 crotonase/enoyl-CoA hydratase family protein [Planktomarina sp.]|tara:strand:+ start:335 stop:1129 length:795 start_codon:yes stop_codon:yes gene_type:complete
MQHLDLQMIDGLAIVTLNRPSKKNALSKILFEELFDVGTQLQKKERLRAVILTGAGNNFCAGIDLNFLQTLLPRMEEVQDQMCNPPVGEDANWFQRPCYIWRLLQVPVIAAIDGICIGAGLQLALSADIRLASPTTRMSIMESKWGLIPDMGITQVLPQLMRADQAKELMMTGRMLDATASERVGLITRIVADPLSAAKDLAKEIMGLSPEAVNGSKVLIDKTWNLSPGLGLAVEAQMQSKIIGTPNQIESVVARLEKRSANFK